MASRLTYGLLFEKLKEIGYSEEFIELNGARQHIFQHPKFERAIIFLPDVATEAPVSSMHLTGVRAVLRAHGVIDDDPDGVFLQELGVNGKYQVK